MRAVSVTRYGGPEVLEVVDVDNPVAAPGQVVVAVTAAGVNYMDTYARTGHPGYAVPPAMVSRGSRRGRGLPGRAPEAATPSEWPCPPRSWCPCPTASPMRTGR